MKVRPLALLAASALAVPASAAKTPPAPLQPSGPWAVEYAKDMCVLSRPFGTGQARLIFAFKPAPNADQARIMLIRQAGREAPDSGAADIRLSDGSRPPWANFMSAAAKGTSLTAIDVPRSSLRALFEGGTIAIRAGKKIDVALAPTGMPKAMQALAKCEADLLKTWGMDEAAQASLMTVPGTNLRQIFKADDYPQDLVSKGVQGSVGFMMKVDASGALSECRVIEPSGTPALDEWTCTLVRRRARFEPARSRDGAPMAAITFQRVNWQIADGGYSYELNTDMGAPPAMLTGSPIN